MRYLSVCSGIEAASVAWRDLGWEPVGFSEIEPFPCAVLKHRFPNVPNFGDMTKFKEWPIERGTVDILVGGTPCQAFSVAGLRGGLEDERGQLMLVYGSIAAHFRPTWFVWENVPGVLSSHTGKDFASFLGLLTGREVRVPSGGWGDSGILGGIPAAYGVAWTILDAQYFGVAQRRKRVFVVGYLGDWRRAASVLFEFESLLGDPPPSREKGQRIAGTLASRTSACGGLGTDFDLSGGLRPAYYESHPQDSRVTGPHDTAETVAAKYGTGGGNTPLVAQTWPADVAPTLNAHFGEKQGLEDQHALNGAGLFVPVLMDQGGSVMNVEHDMVGTLRRETKGHEPVIFQPLPFDTTQITSKANYSNPKPGDPSHPLAAGAHAPAVAFHNRQDPDVSGDVTHPIGAKDNGMGIHAGTAVRRLTPRECERLQGFPDDWTLIPWGKPMGEKGAEWYGKMAPDGPRYKACGNSMAVPVMRWIGRRIDREQAQLAVIDFDAVRAS